MRRVAHLLPNMVTGGRERIVADLCAHGQAFGIDPNIICYDPGGAGRRIDTPGIAQHALDRAAPGFATALRRLVERERIDVLHAQGHIAAALAGPIAADVRVVSSVHVALGGGWRWLPQIARGLRASHAVSAVSHDLARRFGLLAGRTIQVIPPGIDLARFDTARPRGGTTFTIGIAARLHPVKRHRDAIEALRRLSTQGLPCRLSIAGQGPREAWLKAQTRGLDVEFAGDVSDMPAWLAGQDAFLLASDHEGTPVALLEALASGLPCIATNVGGIPAAVGNAAILVPRRDPAAIAAAIARLITRPDERTALADAARKRALDFPVETMCRDHARLYAS